VFVPVPDVATCELVHELHDRPCEVTLHFQNRSGPNTIETLGSIAVRVGVWWRFNVLPLLSFDLHFLQVIATDQSVADGLFVVDTTSDDTGGVVSNAMPASVAPVIHFYTAFGTGVSRNRNYIPGVSWAHVLGNRLHPEWWPAIVEGYDNLIDLATLSDYRWVGLHRFAGSTPLSEGIAARVDHARFLRLTVGQRRKRLHNSFG
jgi:hypothetical protein